MNDKLQYLVGLNLGPVEGQTSMAVVERHHDQHRVVGLERCQHGTPYPAVVEWVRAQLATYPADQIEMIVGGTDVDPSVLELLRQAGFGSKLEAVITVDSESGQCLAEGSPVVN